MFSNPNLDALPPRSQFRRPWSPEPYDPHPSTSHSFAARFQNIEYDMYDREQARSHGTSPRRQQQRREASDVSVEALDLADYARTLRIRQAEDPYPAFASQIRQQNSRPPSSFPAFIPPANSQTVTTSPPSLVSRGPTLSSLTTHHSSSSGRHTTLRPFSLPVTPLSNLHASSSRVHFNPGPHIVDPDTHANPQDEIDISHFPRWSRNWYNPNNPSNQNHAPDPDADIYTPLPPSQFQLTRAKISPFDPGYVHDPKNPYNPYGTSTHPHSSAGHESRDMLPWSNEPPDPGPSVDPMLKEERMRMLEREFGGKGKGKDEGNALVDAEGKPLVGTVDEKGRLVTAGPKRRVVFRTLQILLAIGACIPAIYAAVAIKTDAKKPPPPAGKPPAFVLYILSTVTLLTLFYMSLVRPCCCVRPKSRPKHPLGAAGNLGMMVLPIGGPGGKKNKKDKAGKKGRGKYGHPGAQDVQVNLIVDPTAFQSPDAEESESEDEYGSQDGSMPGGLGGGGYETQEHRARRKKRNRNRRRKGVFEGLAMEEEWRTARAWAKKVAVVDVAGLLVWGAIFVFIMTGKRCPSGSFIGWCNAYNVSTASAFLLCIAFGVTTFFDVQDLHASKQSPRTRS